MRKRIQSIFSFPNPVNETAARIVAGGVVLLTLSYLITLWRPLLFILVYGFLARVLTGPSLSPLGQLATRVIAPHLPISYCPGPPKRFAQGIGLVFSSSGLALALLGYRQLSMLVLSLLVVASSLEAFLGLCLGCKMFAFLMELGLVPQEVCERCNNIWNGSGRRSG